MWITLTYSSQCPHGAFQQNFRPPADSSTKELRNEHGFDWLLPANFMPHGHCYLWRPDVLWLHVGSDSLIALSYYAIPIALAYFVRRRRAVLPYWWVPALFCDVHLPVWHHTRDEHLDRLEP
jgi:hypothetical protein